MVARCTSPALCFGPALGIAEKSRDAVSCQRYEYKYLIPPTLIEPIRSFIAPYCVLDPHSERAPENFYTIRTLYLDSAAYKTYWDKIYDVPNRFKLRIRTYGQGTSAPVKFEVKRRFNEVSVKTSLAMPCAGWTRSLEVNRAPSEFTEAQRSAFESFIGLVRTLGAAPKMLVQYERQAFQARMNSCVRISFDRRICYQPKHCYDLQGQSGLWRFNDDSNSLGEAGARAILELKFMHGVPPWLSDMVRKFDLVRRSFSKYCSAMTRLLESKESARELAWAVPSYALRRAR
jgi:hypothetical protein